MRVWCICEDTCSHIYTNVAICTQPQMHKDTCRHTFLHMHKNTCRHTCRHMQPQRHMQSPMHKDTCSHTYLHMHTETCCHTSTQTLAAINAQRHMQTHIPAHAQRHMQPQMQSHMHKNTSSHKCTKTHADTHTCTCTKTHAATHACTCSHKDTCSNTCTKAAHLHIILAAQGSNELHLVVLVDCKLLRHTRGSIHSASTHPLHFAAPQSPLLLPRSAPRCILASIRKCCVSTVATREVAQGVRDWRQRHDAAHHP